jgi:hypothetical protein
MTAANELLQHCDNVLPGHGPVTSIAERLREIADSLQQSRLRRRSGGFHAPSP